MPGSSALAGNTIYVMGSHVVQALDRWTGHLLWQGDVPNAISPGMVSVAGDVLYVVDGDGAFAYPAAGCGSIADCQPLAQFKESNNLFSFQAPLAVTGGRVLYADYNGLHALGVN